MTALTPAQALERLIRAGARDICIWRAPSAPYRYERLPHMCADACVRWREARDLGDPGLLRLAERNLTDLAELWSNANG